MADYTITARPSGSNQDNNASRIISTYLHYDAATHKPISRITRRDGIWCSCGGSSQRVVLNGYDRLIDTATGEIIKKSTTGSCTCRGTGPSSENYMTCEFTDWTEDESNLAITLWAAGTLKITRTVWIKSYTSADHGSPTFRDGYYNDDITIKGSTVPFTNYAPQILKFEIMRSTDGIEPDDMATSVWAKIRLAMTDISGLSDNPALTLIHSTSQSMRNPDTHEITTLPISDYIEAEQSIELGSAYSIGNNHYFALIFSAGNEASAPYSGSVGMAYVPLHINGNNHGVSVGGYSNATAADERFESMWKSYFHGGVQWDISGVQMGEVQASLSAGGTQNINVTFGIPFKTPPIVLLTFLHTTSSGFGNCSCSVVSVSETGMTIRGYNAGSVAYNPKIMWLAIGASDNG